jgi:lipoprotein-anchoring transpeptidase ErfK/SrfK
VATNGYLWFAMVRLVIILALALVAAPARGQTLLALGESILLDHAGGLQGAAYRPPDSEEVWLHVSISTRSLAVHRGDDVIHEYPVGVGTGGSLRKLDGGRWEWDTPTGIFEVGRMKKDPTWFAPDWYWVEKGQRPPPRDDPRRQIPGALGDYALYIDDEIAIHGTRDRRSVGRASSHGCIRMYNEDIAIVFGLVEIGTKVIVSP